MLRFISQLNKMILIEILLEFHAIFAYLFFIIFENIETLKL